MESGSVSPVLKTKLQPSNLPNDYIQRPKLIEYVNSNIERPLTLISAGAGFGKSTFVSSWVKQLKFKYGWVSLDENDNDVRTFLKYFIAAIQQSIPDFGKQSVTLLSSPVLPPTEHITNCLINDLNSLHDRFFLALDDIYLIHNLEIFKLLSTLLKFPPLNFHLILISRSDPPLPLSKLRASNKVIEVRLSHLQFTDEEIEKFVKNYLKTDKTDNIVPLLKSKMDGWVTGLRLAMLHISYFNKKDDDIKSYLNGLSFSESYFIEEVMVRLDEPTTEFLLKTSILDKFCSSLTGYILSSSNNDFNSSEIIDHFIKNNLFIINLDDENNWYRYHHLFQSLLQKELKTRYSKESIDKLHISAIEWFEKNNYINDAFFHASQVIDVEVTAKLIEKYMHKPLNENKWYELDQWLTKISDDYIQQSPALLIAQMWVLHHKNVIWVIPDLINKVEEIKDNNIKLFEEIRPQLIFFKGIINFWSANVEESLKQFNYFRKNITNDKLGAKSLSIMYYANASQMTGKGDEVYKEIQLEISRNNLHPDYKIILLASLVYIKLLNGDLYAAERIAKRIGKISSTTNNDFYVVWYEFFMGYIAFQQYRLDEALAHFNKTMDFVYFLNTHAPIDAFAGMLLTLGKMKKREKFEQIYNQLSLFTHKWNNPAYNTVAQSLKARLAIAENDLQKASENIKKAEMIFDSGVLVFNIEVPRITYCKFLLAKESHKKTDEAINKLTEILDFVFKINNIPQLIEVLILLSVAYYKKNDLQNAVERLTKALGLAEKGQIIHPFVEQAEYINPLLIEIKSNDDNINDFISIIRKKISNNNSDIKKETLSIESLSNRELDVINLLAQRLSNKEIAEKLFISPTTVKKHTINIYQKLDVNKRLKAVSKAKELGIIN